MCVYLYSKQAVAGVEFVGDVCHCVGIESPLTPVAATSMLMLNFLSFSYFLFP